MSKRNNSVSKSDSKLIKKKFKGAMQSEVKEGIAVQDNNEKTDESDQESKTTKSRATGIQQTITTYFKTKIPFPLKKSSSSNASSSELKREYRGLRNEGDDTIEYRQDPAQTSENDPSLRDNILFYENKIKSVPDGDYIEEILKNWWGDYARLEIHHGYIQWLFPNRVQGLNSRAHALQLHELEHLKSSRSARIRLIKAYQLMLDFYGMTLQSVDSGRVERAKNYKKRYTNLINHRHNFLRISRILKCLGDFDLANYQIKWLEFLIEEIFVNKSLAPLDTSLANYYIHTVKDDQERARLIESIESLVQL